LSNKRNIGSADAGVEKLWDDNEPFRIGQVPYDVFQKLLERRRKSSLRGINICAPDVSYPSRVSLQMLFNRHRSYHSEILEQPIRD
jgi:hypothetical protein